MKINFHNKNNAQCLTFIMRFKATQLDAVCLCFVKFKRTDMVHCLFLSFCLSVLIDKDNSPKWNPSSLSGVSKETVDHYFETLGDRELVL